MFKSRHSDLLPEAILSVGFACDDDDFDKGGLKITAGLSFAKTLESLNESLHRIVSANPAYFSANTAICRVLALDMTLAIQCPEVAPQLSTLQVINFETSDAESALSSSINGAAGFARARERQQKVLLANIDILLVVWDGKRASCRGGLDALVQLAVTQRLPVLVLPPTMETPYLLLQDEDDLDETIASDLMRRDIPPDFDSLVGNIMLPAWSGMEGCLQDLYLEQERPVLFRVEYDLLLAAFRVRQKPSGALPIETQRKVAPSSRERGAIEFNERIKRIDRLATHYANLTRSSSTSGFLVLILVAMLSATVSRIIPSLSGVSILVQIVINGLIVIDMTIRRRNRWVERWLDYRALVERLRAIQVLHPIGRGDGRTECRRNGQSQAWTDWYVRRIQRMLMPPQQLIHGADLVRSADNLLVTIDYQIAYHVGASVQLGRLERRLHLTARIALLATVAIGIGLLVFPYLPFGPPHETWHGMALLLLAVLPACVGAFNGIRADADLVQLVERSAFTASRLKRLRSAFVASDPTHDRVINATIELTRLMDGELSEWRLMLNNRRLRRSR